MKIFNQLVTSEAKIVWGLIIFLIISTSIGIYDRVKVNHLQATSVIPKASVMVIPVEGVITTSGTQWDGSMVDIMLEQLDEAADTKSVKAVVLKINSPGGTVGASQEIYNAIKRFKEESKKPVVVSIMDIGASGAYWIALAGDYIFAHPGSIVGSLGVITQTLDLTQLKNKYGVGMRTYKAGVHKDLLSSWRAPTKDDEFLINKLLDTVHQQFKDVLIENRQVSKDKAHILADGRIYAGQDALEEQLIDALGGTYDAIQYAGKLVGIDHPRVVHPDRGIKDWVQSFRSMAQSMMTVSPQLLGQGGIY